MDRKIFNSEEYNDDRLFVLNHSKCTITEDEESISTTIYHEEPPANYIWCVVMYRNVPRYRVFNVFHFNTEDEAIRFIQETEPVVPLISLNGEPPAESDVLSYDDFTKWKSENKLQDYDYRTLFTPSFGSNPEETIRIPK